MSLLDAIETKFSKSKSKPNALPAVVVPQPIVVAESEKCDVCGGTEFWRAHHSSDWMCEKCRPPMSKSFVAERRGHEGDIRFLDVQSRLWPIVLNYERPVCRTCRGAWIVEFIAGNELMMRCWSCGTKTDRESIEDMVAIDLAKPTRDERLEVIRFQRMERNGVNNDANAD